MAGLPGYVNEETAQACQRGCKEDAATSVSDHDQAVIKLKSLNHILGFFSGSRASSNKLGRKGKQTKVCSSQVRLGQQGLSVSCIVGERGSASSTDQNFGVVTLESLKVLVACVESFALLDLDRKDQDIVRQ